MRRQAIANMKTMADNSGHGLTTEEAEELVDLERQQEEQNKSEAAAA